MRFKSRWVDFALETRTSGVLIDLRSCIYLLASEEVAGLPGTADVEPGRSGVQKVQLAAREGTNRTSEANCTGLRELCFSTKTNSDTSVICLTF